jgi:hypothetical protein
MTPSEQSAALQGVAETLVIVKRQRDELSVTLRAARDEIERLLFSPTGDKTYAALAAIDASLAKVEA